MENWQHARVSQTVNRNLKSGVFPLSYCLYYCLSPPRLRSIWPVHHLLWRWWAEPWWGRNLLQFWRTRNAFPILILFSLSPSLFCTPICFIVRTLMCQVIHLWCFSQCHKNYLLCNVCTKDKQTLLLVQLLHFHINFTYQGVFKSIALKITYSVSSIPVKKNMLHTSVVVHLIVYTMSCMSVYYYYTDTGSTTNNNIINHERCVYTLIKIFDLHYLNVWYKKPQI